MLSNTLGSALPLAGLVLFLALCSPFAEAVNSNTNRQIIPLGESEAFMANTGVGRALDSGAVYYNPAGLAELKSGRVSVTSSVYLSFDTRTDALIYLDNTNVGYEASGFNTIPGFYVAAYRWGDWFGALSILVPDSLQVENHTAFNTPNTQSTIVQSQRFSDLWLGLTAARKISDQWSLGVSVFGVQHQEALAVGLDVQFPGAATSSVIDSLQQLSLNTLGVTAVLGVSFAATDWLRLGLRAQTALVQFYGKADVFQNTNKTVSGVVTTTGESLKNTPANYRLPFDFTLGTSLSPTDWFAFLVDLSLQLGANYESIPASNLSDSVDLNPTPRLNLGFEIKPASWLPVYGGFYYNPSANGGTPGTEGFIQENYYGVTLGVGLKSTRVETGVGGFYIWSKGQTTPIGAPDTTAAVASHGFGGLLTASYLL